jgi:hypothetical protein
LRSLNHAQFAPAQVVYPVPRSLAVGALVGAIALVSGCSCPQPVVPQRATVVSSLRPVDAARPMVVFSPVQGKACGNEAVRGALLDMQRLEGVDGYVEVVIEESGAGAERCAIATGYPFRYGDSTETPALRAGAPSMEPTKIPGRTCRTHEASEAPSAPLDCAKECSRVSKLLEATPIKQGLAEDRCLQRCPGAEAATLNCIHAAQTAESARVCLPE